jgi:hypothetical protein
MRRHFIAPLTLIALASATQYPACAQAEPLARHVGSETTKIAWVWSPEYAKRFNLPENESELKDGPIKAIGLRVSRVEAVGRLVRYSYLCSIELITDGTQDFYFHDVSSYTTQPYGLEYLLPGNITLGADSKVLSVARMHGRVLPAYLGYTQLEDRKKGRRYMSAQYRLFRKEYLYGLQYASFNTGCMKEFLRDESRPVLHVAHASYREKGWIYDDPKSYRIELPSALFHGLRGDLEQAIKVNLENVKALNKKIRNK